MNPNNCLYSLHMSSVPLVFFAFRFRLDLYFLCLCFRFSSLVSDVTWYLSLCFCFVYKLFTNENVHVVTLNIETRSFVTMFPLQCYRIKKLFSLSEPSLRHWKHSVLELSSSARQETGYTYIAMILKFPSRSNNIVYHLFTLW